MRSLTGFFFLLSFVMFSGFKTSAADRYWVGPSGGAYSNGANWNTASDGSGSPGAPTSADNLIIDRDATIFIDGNYFPSSLHIIDSVAVQITTGTARTLTIGGGAVAPAFLIEAGSELDVVGSAAITLVMLFASQAHIYGVLDISGTNSKMDYASGGTTIIKPGGVIRYGGNSGNGTGSLSSFIMEESSLFEIYKNGGSFPTGTYHPNSVIYNTGAVSTPAIFLMSSSTGSYGIYEFDSPDYTSINTGINSNVSFSDFTLISTGTGNWIFSTSPSSAYTMTVTGAFTVGLDCVFEINKSNSGTQPSVVKIAGDVFIEGIVTETGNTNNATIEMNGSNDAYFYAVETGLENDVSLNVNKSGGASVLAFLDIFMPDGGNSKLTFTNGLFDVATFGATMIIRNPSAGAVVGGSLTSHLVGPMTRFSSQVGSYSFPVSNTGDQFAKAVINTASTTLTEWTVEFIEPNSRAFLGLGFNGINQVSDYYWNIFRDGANPSDASSVVLHYGDLANPSVLTPSQLKMVYYNGAIWQNLGGTVSSGTVTNSLGTNGSASPGDPISDFGDFALGGLINTLPVDIEFFTGRRSGKKHDLSWGINCTSTPSVTMILERSADARKFDMIHSLTVDADRCQQAFSYTDASPLPGQNYYRLAVKDLDGGFKYSRIISLFNPGDKALLAGIYPNPAPGSEVIAEIASPSSLKGELNIVDNLGRVLGRRSVNLASGLNKIPLDISALTQGQYRVVLISENRRINVLSFVKSK